MSAELFDMRLRSMRRDRAFAQGPERFLYERVFEDCLERIALSKRRFRSCMLIGCPDPGWPDRLRALVDRIEVADPGPQFATAAGGLAMIEDEWAPPPDAFDLCVAVGTLDSVNDLPRALAAIHLSLKQDSLLIGAVAGGDSLPVLRNAMHAADQLMGASSPHVHPRLDASSLAALLTARGFVLPVIDVDRVQVSYAAFDQLVKDLRRMGVTNVLKTRSRRPLSRRAKSAAAVAFERAGDGQRTVETFEILHFAGWTPAGR